MINITQTALDMIKKMQNDIEEETFLRFGIQSECCNEISYALSLSKKKNAEDHIIDLGDIIVLVHPSDVRFIKGTVIDYSADGMIIKNPNPLVSI
ncbi:HesB/IscA family protein [Jeotgalibacillus soli]|uniref:Core domain-containing protein n=1 Tax=Jeotgalibacillus soli TaxID=889306 RepID=A0A0C2R4L6_9BACL|nr:iron-sulfur cluster biosynthesis family protein [Jeotgalibacillus soli]KIL45210.1 hypothetical protein KP78_27540 [Jeotgalibacillus soli]